MAVASSEAKETENDLNFVYGDCDSYTNEISELYAYTEEEEFQLNLSNFSQLLQSKGIVLNFCFNCWIVKKFLIGSCVSPLLRAVT